VLNDRSWPVATDFSLGPDVSFRGKAEVGQAAETVMRSRDCGKRL